MWMCGSEAIGNKRTECDVGEWAVKNNKKREDIE